MPAPKGLPMVSWFAPAQLVRTGVQVAISAALGTRIDPRRRQPGQDDVGIDAVGEDEGELWFDYVADVGDGVVPTFHVAHGLSRPSLPVLGLAKPLPRGGLLIIGGDLVYPTASREAYQQRLLEPYRTAWAHTNPEGADGPAPLVYAIPGNHDWYDGLVEFSRIFCAGGTAREAHRLAGWRSPQRRSYFVLKLPRRWWLWGLDIQLESDINIDQLDYFAAQAKLLSPGDQVILCTAEPGWVKGDPQPTEQSNLQFLIAQKVEAQGAKVVLELAGDLHHYRHHRLGGPSPRHRIICGGGGAFTHPTHNVLGGGEDADLVDPLGTWTLGRAFPDAEASAALARWMWWRFPRRNLLFCVGLGLVYTSLAWGFPKGNVGMAVGQPLASVWTNLVSHPGAFFATTGTEAWLLTVGIPALGFMAAAPFDVRGLGVRWLGLVHGIVHVVAAIGLYLGLSELSMVVFGDTTNNALPGALRFFSYLGCASVVAGAIFGQYLRTAHQHFHAHANELYSALASPHHTSFLRMHIRPDGALEIFPVGVQKVKRHPCDAQWELLNDTDDGGPIVLAAAKPPAPS